MLQLRLRIARIAAKAVIPASACAAKDDVIPVHDEMRVQLHSLSRLTSWKP